MDNPRPEKVAVVAEVKEKLQNSAGVVLTEYRGLNVNDLAALRSSLQEVGGEYKVYKNTLVRFAAAELDLDIADLLVGPTAIAFTTTKADGTEGDAVSISKALVEFGKTNEALVLKGGILDGEVLDVDKVTELSKIAPREELLSRLAGGMAAPMQKFAALLKALPSNFAYGLQALIDQGGAPGAPESAPEEAVAEEAPAEEPAADAPAEDAAAEAPAEETAAEAPAEAAAETETPAEEPAAEAADDAAAEEPTENVKEEEE